MRSKLFAEIYAPSYLALAEEAIYAYMEIILVINFLACISWSQLEMLLL